MNTHIGDTIKKAAVTGLLVKRNLHVVLIMTACLQFTLSPLAAGADSHSVHVVEPAVTDHLILQDGPLPPVCKAATAMEVFACRGEYEPASFVVMASKPLEGVRIEVGPVSGPGEPWPKEAVDVRVVKEYPGAFGISGLMPMLLVHDESFLTVGPPAGATPPAAATNEAGFLVATEPAAGGNTLKGELRDSPELQPVTVEKRKQFWITVHVPDHAYTGTYTTTLRVVPANSDASELTLRIHVYPFELRAPMIEYSIYYPVSLVDKGAPDWRSGQWTSLARLTEEQYIAECRNMIAHGVTNPNIYGGVGTRPDGTLDYSHIEKILAVREKAGMGPGLPLYLMSAAAEPVSRALTDEEKKERVRIVREIMAWGKHRGYPDVYWAGIDEAWGDSLARERDSFQAIRDGGGKVFVAAGIQFLDLVGHVLQCPVLQSPLPSRFSAAAQKYPADQVVRHTGEIAGAMNYQMMSEMDAYRKCVDGAHRLGHKIFTYMNPPAGLPMPELQRRSEGLGLWRIGFDGTMTWAYTHIKGEPLNQSLMWAKVMRVEGGVLDTLYWEGHREGVDDIRYLTTLLDTLARARGSFPDHPLIRQTDDWLAGIDVAHGNLDVIRREMASRVIALSDLGYKELPPEQALAGVDRDKVQIVAFPEPWKFKLVPVAQATLQGANPSDADQGTTEKWFDPATDDSQWVPMRTDTKEKGWGQETGFGWYRTKLPLTAADAKRKFKYLYFGACDEDARVYVNGQQVFEHSLQTTGLLPEHIWLTPFVAPLTDAKLSGNDLLAVRVTNTEGMGGIWKPVHLVVSDQELTKRQVKALVELKMQKD